MQPTRTAWWSKLATRLRLLRQLHSWGERWLFARIFCFAAAAPLLLVVKLPRLASLLARRFTGQSPAPAQVEQIIRLVELAIQMGRPLIRPKCLTRGLTLYYFLNRAGFAVDLVFGAGTVADNFAAHCWLVKDGEPFLETDDPRTVFATCYVLPNQSHWQ